MSAVSHFRAFREAIAADREHRRGKAVSIETEFLPAALEVIERPISPTSRTSAWILFGGLVASTSWLMLGHLDIVASAAGRVLPSDDVKLVQAANAGIVRRVYVHDGDTVRRGQPLVDLDPTISSADEAQAENGLRAAELDVARDRAIADGLSGDPFHFEPPIGTPANLIDTQRRLISAQVAAAEAQAAGFAAARRSALADAQAASDQVRAYQDTVPVLDRELSMLNELAAEGYAPGLKLLELQRQLRSEQGSRDVASAQAVRSFAEAARSGRQMVEVREQARQQALADLAKAETEVMIRREEVAKTRQRSRMQRLISPTDGTVQQLAIHTVGGVAEAVRPLMTIVPEGGLIVEARVLNRDAGMVHAGQSVSMKLDAFPFSRYGTIPGRIVSINRDAIQDNRSEPFYVARIALDRRTILVDGKMTALTSGLVGTADIRLGSRRIIDYLLSPIEGNLKDAARER